MLCEAQNTQKHVISTRFELVPPKRLEPKSSALDHSAMCDLNKENRQRIRCQFHYCQSHDLQLCLNARSLQKRVVDRLENLGLRHEVAIREPVRLLLTVSLQDRMCVSDMALEASRAP